MKKKFEIPELYIILFTNEDIVTCSGGLCPDPFDDGDDDSGLHHQG